MDKMNLIFTRKCEICVIFFMNCDSGYIFSVNYEGGGEEGYNLKFLKKIDKNIFS